MHNHALITGIGIVSDLGRNYTEHSKNLFAQNSGIYKNHFANGSASLDTFVGLVKKDINVPAKFSNMYRNLQFTVSAIQEAIDDANIDIYASNLKIAITFGTCFGGQKAGNDEFYRYEKGDYRQEYEGSEDKYLQNILDKILDYLGINASFFIISTACSASNNAAILGMQLIQQGEFDVVIAGGSDEITDISLAGFSSLGAINENESAQPYSNGSGISLGEGAGFVVLEKNTLNSEKHVYAELIGGAITSDAYHITTPDPRGEGASKVIDQAIESVGLTIGDIDYVNGHGTGTSSNDSMEQGVLSRKFGSTAIISSTKGLTGHTLGPAGIIELINIITMIENNKIVGTIDKQCQMEEKIPGFLKNDVVKRRINYALNLSFAFGGNNSCLVVAAPGVYKNNNQIYADIAEYGLIGFDTSNLEHGKLVPLAESSNYKIHSAPGTKLTGFEYTDFKLNEKIDPKLYRRFDNFSKMIVKSVARVYRNINLNYKDLDPYRTGILLTTPSGASQTVENIQSAIPKVGYKNVSATEFSFTVMNAAAGVISQCFRIKGPLSVLTGIGSSFIDVYEYASQFVRNNDLDYLLMVHANQVTDYNLFTLDELQVSSEMHLSDYVSTFLYKKHVDNKEMIILNQIQYKFSRVTLYDIENIYSDLLNECGIDDEQVVGIIYNENFDSQSLSFDVINEFIDRSFKKLFDMSEMDYCSMGAGEELAYLLGNVHESGIYVIIAHSPFGGISMLLVKCL